LVSLQKLDDPAAASQVRLQHFRTIEHYCVEGSNKRSDRRALK